MWKYLTEGVGGGGGPYLSPSSGLDDHLIRGGSVGGGQCGNI